MITRLRRYFFGTLFLVSAFVLGDYYLHIRHIKVRPVQSALQLPANIEQVTIPTITPLPLVVSPEFQSELAQLIDTSRKLATEPERFENTLQSYARHLEPVEIEQLSSLILSNAGDAELKNISTELLKRNQTDLAVKKMAQINRQNSDTK